MQVDYLIIGQGISGTFLSYYLLQAGKTVLVIDENNPVAASRVASGIINPVTGRRIVTTWMIDELLPFATKAYEDIGHSLGCNVADEIDMVSFHATRQMQSAWTDRVAEGADYISHIHDTARYEKYFHAPYGAGLTFPCLLVDLHSLLPRWRQKLRESGSLLEEWFDIKQVRVSPGDVNYKDIRAEKLILCNGTGGFDNEFFGRLPYTMNKGEALIVSIPGLPGGAIYKQGMTIVPMGGDIFWVGSSFEWAFQHSGPTAEFRTNVESILSEWLNLPYSVIEHKAAIRPSSVERRPFIGLHPAMPSVGILNGMGTKGCSLAPYFAHQLTGRLTVGSGIHPEADVLRFQSLLSRG